MKRALVLVVTLLFLSGCAVALVGGAGAGGAYAWVKGNLSRHYPFPIDATFEASLAALKNLSIALQGQSHDKFNATITGRMVKSDQKVEIRLERWTDNETRLDVRVGSLGDRAVSTRIHDEIARTLP